jgi:hypothetical protein
MQGSSNIVHVIYIYIYTYYIYIYTVYTYCIYLCVYMIIYVCILTVINGVPIQKPSQIYIHFFLLPGTTGSLGTLPRHRGETLHDFVVVELEEADRLVLSRGAPAIRYAATRSVGACVRAFITPISRWVYGCLW